jgi:hypothetical protein
MCVLLILYFSDVYVMGTLDRLYDTRQNQDSIPLGDGSNSTLTHRRTWMLLMSSCDYFPIDGGYGKYYECQKNLKVNCQVRPT